MATPKAGRLVWVQWYPEDIVNGVTLLEPMEELAYRRILDYIVITKNALPNDDAKLARITKTGRQWPKIKATLLGLGKLYVHGDLIRNKRMDEVIKKALAFSEKQSARARSRFNNMPDFDN